RRTVERKVRHSPPAKRRGRYSTQIDTCGAEGIGHFCAESSPIRSFHAHRMQGFARAETRLLGSGFLLRALDRREEDYPCAGLIRRAASNDEFDIAACALDRCQRARESTRTIRDFTCPHVYFFYRVCHAHTSLNNLIACRLARIRLLLRRNKNRSLSESRPFERDRILRFFTS